MIINRAPALGGPRASAMGARTTRGVASSQAGSAAAAARPASNTGWGGRALLGVFRTPHPYPIPPAVQPLSLARAP